VQHGVANCCQVERRVVVTQHLRHSFIAHLIIHARNGSQCRGSYFLEPFGWITADGFQLVFKVLRVLFGHLRNALDNLTGLRIVLINILVLSLTFYSTLNVIFHCHHIADILLQCVATFLHRLFLSTHGFSFFHCSHEVHFASAPILQDLDGSMASAEYIDAMI
jgi:hypothetical protein